MKRLLVDQQRGHVGPPDQAETRDHPLPVVAVERLVHRVGEPGVRHHRFDRPSANQSGRSQRRHAARARGQPGVDAGRDGDRRVELGEQRQRRGRRPGPERRRRTPRPRPCGRRAPRARRRTWAPRRGRRSHRAVQRRFRRRARNSSRPRSLTKPVSPLAVAARRASGSRAARGSRSRTKLIIVAWTIATIAAWRSSADRLRAPGRCAAGASIVRRAKAGIRSIAPAERARPPGRAPRELVGRRRLRELPVPFREQLVGADSGCHLLGDLVGEQGAPGLPEPGDAVGRRRSGGPSRW